MSKTNKRFDGNENGNRNSRQIEREIERTRGDMDRTLNEIGDRLHPKHLLDEALGLFRSSDGQSSDYARQARGVGKQILRKVQQHPIPALLCGAGLAWLMLEDEDERDPRLRAEWDDLPEHGGSSVDARTGEPYDESYGGPWRSAAAWHDDYDWSDAEYDETSWNERAEKTLADLKQVLSDSASSSQQKLRSSASKLMSVSGRKRSEIHSQWADIPEHSGSSVDARTGEPYDDSYGAEWRALVACDVVAGEDWSEEDEQSWSERANETLSRMQESLNDTQTSVKQRLRAAAGHIGSFAEGTRAMSRRTQSSARRRAARMAGQARRGARGAQRQLRGGYDYTRDTMEEHPLATGAAVLGLGLLVGALLPSTRQESRWMGSASDETKRRAREKGREALHRGSEVAKTATSAAADEMERQHLTPEDASRSAKRAASRAQQAASEELPSADRMKEKVAQVAERTMETAKQEAETQRREMT